MRYLWASMIREDPFIFFVSFISLIPFVALLEGLEDYRRLKKGFSQATERCFFLPNRVFLVYARFGDIPVEFEFSGCDKRLQLSLEGCSQKTQEIWTGRVIPPPPLRTSTGISCQTKHLLLFFSRNISALSISVAQAGFRVQVFLRDVSIKYGRIFSVYIAVFLQAFILTCQ